VAVFCDGDFWHGRELNKRLAKLARGNNSNYWQAKISSNVARDKKQTETLEGAGWMVLRFWATDIRRDLQSIVGAIVDVLDARRHSMSEPSSSFLSPSSSRFDSRSARDAKSTS
jgi:DNA mismatch endonuclease, patch repair protein